MTDEITLQPGQQQLQAEKPAEAEQERPLQQQMQQAQYASGVPCPKCGTINTPDSQFCASCGANLRQMLCPICGSEIDADADFCEVCHHYIKRDVCSFCDAHISDSDDFCPECGSPRGGIVCPMCHTLNEFSFCKQCGQPITEEARQLLMRVREMPEYKALMALAHEYNELQMELPYTDEQDRERDKELSKLRERVLRLLAEDEGEEAPLVVPRQRQRFTKEELDANKKRKMEQLSELLDRMSAVPEPTPAKVRNYAMAQKPAGVRLAWRCNYKNALHSSPCGCAKPQMGGKWVILGHHSNQEIKDDK